MAESTGNLPAVEQAPSPGRGFLVAALVLCLAGLGVAGELTRIHVLIHTDPSFHTLCAVSDKVNCETVALSPYSVFWGVPNSVWGLIGYAVMGALALWGLTRKRLAASWPFGALLLLATFSAGVSAALGYISTTKIDSICLYCMASYGLNLILLVVVALGARKAGGLVASVRADLKSLLARPALFGTLVVLGLAPVVAAKTLIKPYWATTGLAGLGQLAEGVTEDGLHWIGAKEPKLTIVEFSDYECPFCRMSQRQVRTFVDQNRDKVRFIHRHMPLDQACNPMIEQPFHQRACEFAFASECAAEQGKFWAMNDALFSTQDQVKAKDVDVDALATRIGLDTAAFAACMKSGKGRPRIEADLEAAHEHKLMGTPTYFIGKTKIEGVPKPADLEKLLKAAAP